MEGRNAYINCAAPFCFDASVCAPMNKLCPNDGGAPVGCKNRPVPALALVVLNAGNPPAPAPAPAPTPPPTPGVSMDARNGFAAPRPRPVACGRSPTPSEEPPPNAVVGPPVPVPIPAPVGLKPVGCVARPKPPRPAPPLVPVPKPIVGDDTPLRPTPNPAPAGAPKLVVPVVPTGGNVVAVEAESSAGVDGSDCGIGGSASSSDAPNDDVGLNALTPPVKPVVCGRNGAPVGWLDRKVLPVGCPPSELKSRLEEVEPVDVVAVRLVGVEVSILGEPKEVISGEVIT